MSALKTKKRLLKAHFVFNGARAERLALVRMAQNNFSPTHFGHLFCKSRFVCLHFTRSLTKLRLLRQKTPEHRCFLSSSCSYGSNNFSPTHFGHLFCKSRFVCLHFTRSLTKLRLLRQKTPEHRCFLSSSPTHVGREFKSQSTLKTKKRLLKAHFVFNGADRETRTPDPLITNQLLYQLSYVGLLNAAFYILARLACQ